MSIGTTRAATSVAGPATAATSTGSSTWPAHRYPTPITAMIEYWEDFRTNGAVSEPCGYLLVLGRPR